MEAENEKLRAQNQNLMLKCAKMKKEAARSKAKMAEMEIQNETSEELAEQLLAKIGTMRRNELKLRTEIATLKCLISKMTLLRQKEASESSETDSVAEEEAKEINVVANSDVDAEGEIFCIFSTESVTQGETKPVVDPETPDLSEKIPPTIVNVEMPNAVEPELSEDAMDESNQSNKIVLEQMRLNEVPPSTGASKNTEKSSSENVEQLFCSNSDSSDPYFVAMPDRDAWTPTTIGDFEMIDFGDWAEAEGSDSEQIEEMMDEAPPSACTSEPRNHKSSSIVQQLPSTSNGPKDRNLSLLSTSLEESSSSDRSPEPVKELNCTSKNDNPDSCNRPPRIDSIPPTTDDIDMLDGDEAQPEVSKSDRFEEDGHELMTTDERPPSACSSQIAVEAPSSTENYNKPTPLTSTTSVPKTSVSSASNSLAPQAMLDTACASQNQSCDKSNSSHFFSPDSSAPQRPKKVHTYKCSHCQQLVPSFNVLSRLAHISRSHNEIRLSCVKCIATVRVESFQEHLLAVHATTSDNLSCTEFNVLLYQKQINHEMTRELEDRYFPGAGRVHRRKHVRSSTCKVCKKEVLLHRMRHIAWHEDLRIECPIEGCATMMFSSTHLKEHRMSVNDLCDSQRNRYENALAAWRTRVHRKFEEYFS